MGRDDPFGALVALGAAPRETTFAALLEASRAPLQLLVRGRSLNAQSLSLERVPLGLFAHGLEDVTLRDYVQEYWKSDPMTPQGLLRNGRAVSLASCATRRELERTPFWNDLLVPSGIGDVLGVTAALPAGGTFQLACHRGRRQRFSDQDERRWELAAAELTRALAALAFRQQPEREGVGGVLLFDRSAQLLHADDGAGPLFARLVARGRGPWLASRVREVAARSAKARDRVASAAVGEGLTLELRFSVAHGISPGPTVAVSVATEIDPAQRAAERARRLGLSPREAAVSALVARGLSNREVAHALGVRPVTVRDHLRRIFATLAVRSRTELVSRLLRET